MKMQTYRSKERIEACQMTWKEFHIYTEKPLCETYDKGRAGFLIKNEKSKWLPFWMTAEDFYIAYGSCDKCDNEKICLIERMTYLEWKKLKGHKHDSGSTNFNGYLITLDGVERWRDEKTFVKVVESMKGIHEDKIKLDV